MTEQTGHEQTGHEQMQRDQAPSPAATSAPETGDLVVDGALRDLAAVDADDLDATLTAGEAVHSTLTARLSDLGT